MTEFVVIDINNDPVLDLLEKVAGKVQGIYWRYTTQAGLYEEAWHWRIRHPRLVQEFMDKEDPKGLERVITNYLVSVARREKAAFCGYEPDDEVFYTPKLIAELLPMVMDIESSLAPSSSSDEKIGRNPNPHRSSDFVTSLIDVRRAWVKTAFRGTEMALVEAHYVDGLSEAYLAASYSMTPEDVKRTLASGLRRMSDFLGGFPGKSCGVSCECREVAE